MKNKIKGYIGLFVIIFTFLVGVSTPFSALAMDNLLEPQLVPSDVGDASRLSTFNPSTYDWSADPDVIKALNYKDYYSKDKKGKSVLAATPNVAIVTLFSDPTIPPATPNETFSDGFARTAGTHSFITVRNTSSANITIGKFGSIAPGKTMSLGTWGNKSEHIGLWYDLEAYLIAKNSTSYAGRVSAAYLMNSTELSTLNTFVVNNDFWGWLGLKNCAFFAANAWNATVPSYYRFSSGIMYANPKSLADNMKSLLGGGIQYGAAVPYNYIVYYAQGTGTPKPSTVYK